MRSGCVLLLTLAAAFLVGWKNYFLQFPVLEIRAGDVERDLESFDRAAAKAGLQVTSSRTPFTYENRHGTTLRIYKSAGCCFSLSLHKWNDEPLLGVVISDTNRSEHPFEPSDCAIYVRFREALASDFQAQRIVMEKQPCVAAPGADHR